MSSPDVDATIVAAYSRAVVVDVVELNVVNKDRKFVSRDRTLQWHPYKIKGIFIHGELNGITVVHTNTFSSGWVTTKDGVLHGPCIFHGLQPILPVRILHILASDKCLSL